MKFWSALLFSMANVKISHIIGYSSQDSKYPAKNLLNSDIGSGWLCSGDDMRRGRCEITIMLSYNCVFSNIDIGNNGSFSIEIQAAQCGSGEFVTLVPATMFMTPSESRLAINRNSIKMFKSSDITERHRDKTWERLKIVCSQPHRRDKAFGISMLRIISETTDGLVDLNESTTSDTSCCSRATEPDENTAADNYKLAGNLTPAQSANAVWFKEALENRLNQISSSGSKSLYSHRNIQMVMKAVKTPTHKTPLTQDLMNNRTDKVNNRPATFMATVKQFFKDLDFDSIDPYNTQVSELRHRLERQKCRKLDSGEKKIFKAYAIEFFTSRVDNPLKKDINPLEGRTPVRRPKAQSAKSIELANQLTQKLLNSSSAALSGIETSTSATITMDASAETFPPTTKGSPEGGQKFSFKSSSSGAPMKHTVENKMINLTDYKTGAISSSQLTTPKPLHLLQPFRRASLPSGNQSSPYPAVSKRRSVSTAVTVQENITPRAEVRPGAIKRSLRDLLSDDDDDLMIPVTKAAKLSTSTPTITTSTTRTLSGLSARADKSCSSKLSLQDLLSSDDEELELLETSMNDEQPSLTVLPAASSPGLEPSGSPIPLSSDDEDLPELGSDIEEVTVDSQAAILSSIQKNTKVMTQPSVTQSKHSSSNIQNFTSESFKQPSYGEVSVFSTQLSETKARELNLIQCPICSMYFSIDVIESHASDCIID